jgi:hypothetical protein
MSLSIPSLQKRHSPNSDNANAPLEILNAKLNLLIWCLLAVISFISIWPIFFPHFSDINPWDEVYSINSGRMIFGRQFPVYAANPLVSMLYAIVDIFVRKQVFWILYADGIGRAVIFVLIWMGAYLIAKQMRGVAQPALLGCFLLISPVFKTLLMNSSDGLFTALSSLAFWNFLCYYQTRNRKDLWITSALLGLAALSRNDGLTLECMFLCVASIMEWRKSEPENRFRQIKATLVACTLPFMLLVPGYIAFKGIVTHNFSPGTKGRVYTAFEQGQGAAYAVDRPDYKGDIMLDGQVEARRLFGTYEKNHGSVLKAIARNPSAFFARVREIIKTSPTIFLWAYSINFLPLLIICLLVGIAELIRTRQYSLLAIILMWPAHLLVYFALFFRTGYFLLPYFSFFLLASIGLATLFSKPITKANHFIWLVCVVAVLLFGLVTHNSGWVHYTVPTGIFLIAYWIITFSLREKSKMRQFAIGGIAFGLFAISFYQRDAYVFPHRQPLGSTADEQAVIFMKRNLPFGTPVGSNSPEAPLMAKMCYIPMFLDLRQLKTSQDFDKWADSQNIKAIFLDQSLETDEPDVYNLVEKQIGHGDKVVFVSTNGLVQVVVRSN